MKRICIFLVRKTFRPATLVAMLLSVTLLVKAGKDDQMADPPDYKAMGNALRERFGDRFDLSVLIAGDHGILYAGQFGPVGHDKTRSIDGSTLFNIASVTKSVTAVAIFQLIGAGRLTKGDSLGRFFNGVPAEKRGITIERLLTHTSGFRQDYVCDGVSDPAAAVRKLLNDSLGFAPGTGFGYSNQNFEMLALIIEKVTGTTYEKFVRRNIFRPAGMHRTRFWNETGPEAGAAPVREPIPPDQLGRNWGYIGSGGLWSTARDLYRFHRALLRGRLVSKAALAAMFSIHHTLPSGPGIGYGWFISESSNWNTREIWTRGTEDWGHNAVIRWFPDRGTLIIVCTGSGEMGDKQTTGNRLVSDFVADYLWGAK